VPKKYKGRQDRLHPGHDGDDAWLGVSFVWVKSSRRRPGRTTPGQIQGELFLRNLGQGRDVNRRRLQDITVVRSKELGKSSGVVLAAQWPRGIVDGYPYRTAKKYPQCYASHFLGHVEISHPLHCFKRMDVTLGAVPSGSPALHRSACRDREWGGANQESTEQQKKAPVHHTRPTMPGLPTDWCHWASPLESRERR